MTLDVGIIGNCAFGALVNRAGRIHWACLPRFDGDPFFSSLLNDDGAGDESDTDRVFGFYDVALDRFERSEQRYLDNTAILVTTLYDANGGAVELTDFAPRFELFGRFYRPAMIVRLLRPLTGAPRVRIRLRPAWGYGTHRPERTHGSNHIRYVTPDHPMRLTTDAPVSYVLDEVPFVVERPITLLLGPDESITRAADEVGSEFFEKTLHYWEQFSRYLSIPFEWQDAVIRAAITLKLCSFEETGAIIAAMTTSIPEAPNSRRNWDYRYCWLRDALFVVHALNRLGQTGSLERFLGYITNVVAGTDGYLQPVFGIALEERLVEAECPTLKGYRGMGPVRVGNQAYEQVQNDGYGSVILATTQAFFDSRLGKTGTVDLFHRLERVGEEAARRYDQPDAGLWERRGEQRVHTYSAVMCWAACARLAGIAEQLALADRATYWHGHAERIRREIETRAWDPEHQRFTAALDGVGAAADASLLLLHELGFLDAADPRFAGTVAGIERDLRRGHYVFRYTDDDFGAAENAFTICTFWFIDALDALGRREEARELFEHMLTRRNHLGLLSEDLDPRTGELWGNFPQTYSMVGLINSARRLSKPWEQGF